MLKFGAGFVAGFVALFVLMLAFGDYDDPAMPQAVQPIAAAQGSVPNATVAPSATDAPVATQVSTTTPTVTPVPTATPAVLAGYSAPDILHAFRTAGLPLGEVIEYTAETDPNSLLGRPNQYIQKINWKDTRVQEQGEPGTDTGGTVEVFANVEDMEARKAYVDAFARSAAFLTQYMYSNGAILVRLTGELTPEQAREYEHVLLNLPLRN